jgi:hypothetical protein
MSGFGLCFMQDETQILTKESLTAPPKAVTETKVETTTTTTGQPVAPDESSVWGASGRFWITFILAMGLPILPIFYLVVIVAGVQVDAAVFKDVFFAYIGVASVAVGTYLGQKSTRGSGG